MASAARSVRKKRGKRDLAIRRFMRDLVADDLIYIDGKPRKKYAKGLSKKKVAVPKKDGISIAVSVYLSRKRRRHYGQFGVA